MCVIEFSIDRGIQTRKSIPTGRIIPRARGENLNGGGKVQTGSAPWLAGHGRRSEAVVHVGTSRQPGPLSQVNCRCPRPWRRLMGGAALLLWWDAGCSMNPRGNQGILSLKVSKVYLFTRDEFVCTEVNLNQGISPLSIHGQL